MIIIIAIILGCAIGAILGINAPIIPYTFSGYLAVAIIAALDSVFGAFVGDIKEKLYMENIYFRFFWEMQYLQ